MSLNPELMKLVRNTKNKYSNSTRAFKLPEGRTQIRLVGKPGEKFWAELGVHWIKTSLEGKPVAVVGCADLVKGEPCEVCAAIDAASKTVTDDESLKIIKEWRAKETVLVNALVRSGSKASEEPQVVELAKSAFGAMLSTIELYAANDPPIDILDLVAGIDFIVERSGKGFDTKYAVMVPPSSKPVPAGTLEKLVDLDAYIEKEFFRGEEKKALNAISSMTGISTGLLTGPVPTKPGLLTGPSACVDDAAIEEAVIEGLEEVAPPVAAAPAAATVAAAPTALDPAAALAAAKVKAAAAAAKPAVVAAAPVAAPAAAPVAAAPAIAPTEFGTAISNDDEVSKMLAELDGLDVK